MEVIEAGGALVKARHCCKDEASARLVKGEFGVVDFSMLRHKVEIAEAVLTKRFGILGMEFGPGKLHLADAQETAVPEKRYAHLLCAHLEFKRLLDQYKIANPTNEQLSGSAGTLNWR